MENFKKVNRQEIRRAVATNKSYTRASASYSGEHGWRVMDSSMFSFAETFFYVLPKSYQDKVLIHYPQLNRNESMQVFKSYIEDTLQSSRHERVGIEFGGPGSKLFSGFSKDFFKFTVGVCLKDIRSSTHKEEDDKVNHVVSEGDLFDIQNTLQVKEVIKNKTGSDNADFIISRMCGPLNTLNLHPAVMHNTIKRWYDILSENGVMFIQYNYQDNLEYKDSDNPRSKEDKVVMEWSRELEKNHPQIEVQVNAGILRLHKKVGAPEKLPRVS